MFYLRSINELKAEKNEILGMSYVKVNLLAAMSEDSFEEADDEELEILEGLYKKYNNAPIIIKADGKEYPLYPGETYYVMTEEGKTYEKITPSPHMMSYTDYLEVKATYERNNE